MSYTLTEDEVEEVALEILQEMGYETVQSTIRLQKFHI